jgi:hypothetical protein
MTETASPTPADLRRWRKHLANERAEAEVYRDLAQRYDGEEREILAAIAAAEERHEQHWLNLLGDQVGTPGRADLGTRCVRHGGRGGGVPRASGGGGARRKITEGQWKKRVQASGSRRPPCQRL